MNFPRPSVNDDDPQALVARRLQYALFGRLVVATVVLGGTLLLADHARIGQFTPTALYGLIVLAYATSAASAIAISRRSRVHGATVVLHIATDLALASGLVYLTGGAESGFTVLYGAAVLATAFVGTARSVALVAGTTVVAYVTLAVGLANGWIPGPPDQPVSDFAPDGPAFGRALLRNLVGLVLVGGLAATLAERLGRARLELEGYARLHEDVVRSLNSGLVTLGPDDRIRTANPAAASILGTASPEALVGSPIDRYIELSGASIERREATARRHDGSEVPLGFTRVPLRSAEGNVEGSIVIFQDLTELRALRSKAERAERLAMLGALAAGLAHEIRNPLGSIAGSVELVKDAPQLSDEDRRLLDMVLRETDRLNELVRTMLEVGRAAPPERTRVRLAPIVRDVAELAQRGCEGARLTWTVQPDESAEGNVDPGQWRQVLWNLVRNAMQHSPPGGLVQIRVSSDEDACVLEVEDEGPGIPEEERTLVFDMFFTRRRGGVGLGLALSKQIVEAHQGEISVRPASPRGSIFAVRVPHEFPSSRA